jgi:predicted RNA-binding Zn-ribbon protein involved in translation (DUF1610 family)
MKKRQEAKQAPASVAIVSAHDLEIVCASCGYDLEESELKADKCSDCGQLLGLRQNIVIEATSIPLRGES